jgi:hypothetical protein
MFGNTSVLEIILVQSMSAMGLMEVLLSKVKELELKNTLAKKELFK